MTNNQISFMNYQETKRANVAREHETNRSNVARENETHRSNIVYENETRRSNLAKERETNRSNLAKEQETNRSNLAKEQESKRANLAKEHETNRTNVMHEQIDIGKLHATQSANAETKRHNLMSENLSSKQNAIAEERNRIEQYIAELKNAMETSRLSFDQQREAQRIVESMRDYQLALGKTMMSGFNGTNMYGLNAARTAASAAVGAGLANVGTRVSGSSFGSNQTGRLTGASSGGTVATVLKRISKAPLLLWFKHLGDLQPNYSNKPYHYTAADVM